MSAQNTERTTERKRSSRLDMPTIFVKLKGTKDAMAKRILLPKSLHVLIASCQKALQSGQQIQCLLDENGCVIESMTAISPGSKIVASTIDPEFEECAPGSRSPRAKVVSNITAVEAGASTLLQEEEKKVVETPVKRVSIVAHTTRRKGIDFASLAPPPIEEDEDDDDEPLLFMTTKKDEKEKEKKTGRIDLRKISRPTSDSDSDEDSSPVDARSVSTRFTAFMTQSKGDSSDEEDEELKRQREERRKRAEEMNSCVVLDDEANEPFQQLIEELIPPSEAPKTLEKALENIRKERIRFIQQSSDREGDHLYMWIQGASDQPFLEKCRQQPGKDLTIDITSAFFTRHRYICGKNTAYRFKGAIAGPARAGKTGLLGSAVQQYLLELAVAGLWKTTFVFATDLRLFVPLFNDYIKFYRTLLDHVLDACQKQQPSVLRYLSNVRKQMRSVTETQSPLLGHHPFTNVDALARHMYEMWRDPEAFGPFITSVFLLPIALPKALGFMNISLFYDNIEYTDVTISPHAPFAAGPGSPVIEHVKFSLTRADFIVGSESVYNLYNIARPMDDQGVDLLSGLDVMTLFETVTDLGSRTRYEYIFDIQEEPHPVHVTVVMCGGIPAYLAAWDALNQSLFQLERTTRRTPGYDEIYYRVIIDAQDLAELLFVCPGSKITVSNVKRSQLISPDGRPYRHENRLLLLQDDEADMD